LDTTERAQAEAERRNTDELLLTVLRDGKERPASELLPTVESIAPSFMGGAALPARLYDERLLKNELTSATNRLKRIGVLQVQGTGARRTVKLINPPEWVVRDKELLNQAEADISRELLKLLGDGEWHSPDVLLSLLQELQLPKVSDIGKFALAHAALEQSLREGRSVRRSSGRAGTIDYKEEIKLAGPERSAETTQMAQGDRSGVSGRRDVGKEGAGEGGSTSAGIPSQSTEGESTNLGDSQADPQTPTGNAAGTSSQSGPGESESAADANGADCCPSTRCRIPSGWRHGRNRLHR